MATEERFPSASHKSQLRSREQVPAERPKGEPVVKGNVQRKDKTKGSLIADDIRDVKDYVVKDVIVPNVKSTVFDVLSKGLSMMLWGEDKAPKSGTRFNYNQVSSNRDRDNYRPRTRVRTQYDVDDIIFDSRSDAERVLEKLMDIFDATGAVSIGDLYDAAGQQTLSTDFDWGWTNMREATVEHSRDGGYYIYLPRPVSLSRR